MNSNHSDMEDDDFGDDRDSDDHDSQLIDEVNNALGTFEESLGGTLYQIKDAVAQLAGVIERLLIDGGKSQATLGDMLRGIGFSAAADAADEIEEIIGSAPSDGDDLESASESASEWAEVLLEECRQMLEGN